MRIIKPEELATARLGANEAFFVELLYSMTHQKSLDSYRVRCMNSRMLIRELAEELAIGLIKPCDLIGVSTETKLSLSTDPVISTYFSSHLNIISTFWDNPPQAERDNKKRDLEKEKEFLFITNDFSSALEKSYWKYCCAILPGTINSGDKERIKTVLSNTIADLVDRGWPIETVFSWHDHFLAPKNIKAYGFDKNLSFMLKMFSKKEQQFEVTLRLTGSDNLSKLGGFGDFTFSPLPDNLGEGAPKKFRTATNLVCFAQANVDDSDFLSAAINAKESFEQFIDILRFDYEPYHLKIDQTCHVKRLSDGKIELPVVRTIIPNPNSDLDHSNFISFMEGLKTLSARGIIEESSLRKIRGSIRQYRFGRDSDNYKDKFLNWWMGLEAVAHIGRGESIGEVVSYNVSRLMVLPYLSRILGDALATMKYVAVEWHPDLKTHCNGKELADLTLDDLLLIINSAPLRTKLLSACSKSPTMHYRFEQLFDVLIDPVKTLQKIEAHLNQLEWQMARLYRIRCCIVHGSDVRFRLSLFAANLEFYLKETIKYLIVRLNANDHIRNLDEVFSRGSVTYNRIANGLKSANAGSQEIRNAIFANIVV